MATEIENRQNPRITITLPVRMIISEDVMEGETENMSLHGAFIRCQEPLEPRERLITIVELYSDSSSIFHSEVVWSRVPRLNDKGTRRGMGVKFLD